MLLGEDTPYVPAQFTQTKVLRNQLASLCTANDDSSHELAVDVMAELDYYVSKVIVSPTPCFQSTFLFTELSHKWYE